MKLNWKLFLVFSCRGNSATFLRFIAFRQRLHIYRFYRINWVSTVILDNILNLFLLLMLFLVFFISFNYFFDIFNDNVLGAIVCMFLNNLTAICGFLYSIICNHTGWHKSPYGATKAKAFCYWWLVIIGCRQAIICDYSTIILFLHALISACLCLKLTWPHSWHVSGANSSSLHCVRTATLRSRSPCGISSAADETIGHGKVRQVTRWRGDEFWSSTRLGRRNCKTCFPWGLNAEVALYAKCIGSIVGAWSGQLLGLYLSPHTCSSTR